MKKIVAWLGLTVVVGCNTGAIQVGSTSSSGSPGNPPVPGTPTVLATITGTTTARAWFPTDRVFSGSTRLAAPSRRFPFRVEHQ